MPNKRTVPGQGANLDHGWDGSFDDARLDTPTFHRNHVPIVEVLKRHIPAHETGLALEIGSGSGQHVTGFASAFPNLSWMPTDPDSRHRESIAAWRAATAAPNVAAPVSLDASANNWPISAPRTLRLIVCINVLHIAPWAVTQGILAGADKYLAPDGHLLVYGPFKQDGRHTAESNAAFDENLRARNSSWGIRDLSEIERLAEQHNLAPQAPAMMPANNLTLVFRRIA